MLSITKKLLIFCFLNLYCMCYVSAQTQITGSLFSESGEPIPFANIWIDEVYDGATSNEQGHFQFTTEYKGSAILIISCVGYETKRQAIQLNGEKLELKIRMNEAANTLNTVTISAGSFEASDEKKAVLLKPLDIVQTPGAQADIFGAIQKLPGVQPMGDETGIFVRGGEAYETRTFIDGSLVDKPFFSEVPQIPGRGRFDPFLFKGTMFSTGAYSAEYGQALSGILALETQDMPTQTGTAISLNTAGLGLSHTKNWEATSLFADVGYVNLQPLYKLSQTFAGFAKAPEGFGGSLGFRQKTGGKGLIKAMVRYDVSNLGINYPQFNNSEPNTLMLSNSNFFSNASYKRLLGKSWDMHLSFSHSSNHDDITISNDRIPTWEHLTQNKIVLARDIGANATLKTGTEWHFRKGIFNFNEFEQNYADVYNGSFVEADFMLFNKLAVRAGLRSNYSQYLNDFKIVPRLSVAYGTGANSQISLAYGQFTQAPDTEILRQTDQLDFERAQHFLANYQWTTERFTFRVEAYHKRYKDLALLESGNSLLGDPNAIFSNHGEGYAQGIDIFWRDKKALDKIDYWISYSFLDTERLYRDFATTLPPRFAAKHTAQTVVRANFFKRRLQLGGAFTYSSGRPFYFGPSHPKWSGTRTPDFYQLSFNASYVTSLFQQFAVLYASLENPFGWKNVTSYQFNQDYSQRRAVSPPLGRQFFIGLFINIR